MPIKSVRKERAFSCTTTFGIVLETRKHHGGDGSVGTVILFHGVENKTIYYGSIILLGIAPSACQPDGWVI
jgi:hypothetical protein